MFCNYFGYICPAYGTNLYGQNLMTKNNTKNAAVLEIAAVAEKSTHTHTA